MPNGGYIKENGITVCPEHHLLVEAALAGCVVEAKYYPDALYNAIGSSKEKAMAKDGK